MVKEAPEAIEAAPDSNKHQPAIATFHKIAEFLSSPSPNPQWKTNKVPKRIKEKGIWAQG